MQKHEVSNLVKFRKMNESDISFIFNSWLKCHRHSKYTRGIASPIYYSGQHRLIERAITDGETYIACAIDDDSHIYGYACASRVTGQLAVHYIYVKSTYRNLGIGKELLNQYKHDLSTGSCHTHASELTEILAPKFNMVYHPYLLMELYNEQSNKPIAINQLAAKNSGNERSGSEESTQEQIKE